MSLNQHPMLNVAIGIVRKAASFIIEASLKKNTIISNKKAEGELVTNVDIEVDSHIIANLKKAFPTHKFLSEEGGIVGNLNSDYLWILDPIDGTVNFSHLFPHYCISLALQYKSETELGIIYQTSCDYLFSAVKGEGAQMNNKRIRVSEMKSFDDSLICISTTPFSSSNITPQYFNTVKSLGKIRMSGATALDLAYVAAGIYDGFLVPTSPKLWDLAAGVLLVRESGGLVLNLNNSLNYIEGPLVAGNKSMTEKILDLYNSFK